MDEESYMTERADDQIAWYDKRSGQYQRQFKQIRIWQILCASTIPFLTGFSNDRTEIQIIIGLLSDSDTVPVSGSRNICIGCENNGRI